MSIFNYQTNKAQQNSSSVDDDYRQSQYLGFVSISKCFTDKTAKNVEQHKKMDMVYNYMVKNDIKTQKPDDIKQEKVRKTRKDRQGRKFICGQCKLGYLSYPALYTHIKTKHNGQTPQGTMRGESSRPKKRGRPKVRKAPEIYQKQIQKKQLPKQLQGIVIKQNLQILQLQLQNIQTGEDQQCEVISKYFVQILKQLRKISSTQPYLLSISQILSVFLDNLKQFISEQAMFKFQQVFLDFIHYADQHYQQILNQYQQKSQYYISYQLKPQQRYCKVERPVYIPFFIQKYIKIKQLNELQLTILYDFAKWLYQNKLSDILLIKNTEYNFSSI